MKQAFRSSRRDLLKFLTAGGAAATAAATVAELPDPAEGIVLATPAELQQLSKERGMVPAQLPVELQSGSADVVPWVLYEKLELHRGIAWPVATSLFQLVVSQRCSPAWTNMWSAGTLPPPQSFLLQQMYILVDPASDSADVSDFLCAHSYRFMLQEKAHHGGICLQLARVGTLDDVTVTLGDFSNRWESMRGEIGRRHSISSSNFGADFRRIGHLHIPSLTYFGVELRREESLPAPAGESTMWFCLDGLLARAVQ